MSLKKASICAMNPSPSGKIEGQCLDVCRKAYAKRSVIITYLAHLFNYKIEIGNDFTLFESLDRPKTPGIPSPSSPSSAGTPERILLRLNARDFCRPFG
jgi:hypothetical protein